MATDSINQTNPTLPANEDQLTVEYWRERFRQHLTSFNSLVALADKLATLDSTFSGAAGYVKLINIRAGRSSLQLTAKAVKLLEQDPDAGELSH